MQRALARLIGDTKQAADSVDRAFGTAPPKIDNVAKSLNKTRFETANLAAQFQDIAVQLQGGQNPFTIALQQGTQINQVIGQRGAAGAVALLGGAFGSLLNPVSLATIGIIALGGYAVQYGAKAIGATKSVDDALKDHSEAIKALKDSYGDAAKGADDYIKKSKELAQAKLGQSSDDLQKQFKNLSAAALDALSTTRSAMTGYGNVIGSAVQVTDARFSAFKQQIDDLRTSAKNGAPDFRTFATQISEIRNTTSDEKVRKLADEVLNLIGKLPEMNDLLSSSGRILRQLSPDAIKAAEQFEAFGKAMKALDNTVSPNLTDRQKIMENYNKAVAQASGTEERLAAGRARDAQLSIVADNERKKAAEKAASAAESAQKRFDSALDSSSKRSAQAAGETAALGQGAGAIARLETQYRLTEAAQQAFGTVSADTAKKIQDVADKAGVAADALARAKLASQIDFNRQTAFLTDEDVQIARQLATIYGNNVPAALRSTEAAGIKAVNALRTISDVGQDVNRSFLLDFTQQIRQGASAMDALRTAGVNALGKIADKLVSMAADDLWKSAFGGSGGLNLFSLLGLGGSSVGNSVGGTGLSLTATGGHYANGTDFAKGGLSLVGENGPELLNIPRGAQVIPNDILRAQGGGGVTAPVSISIDARGADAAGLAKVQQQLSDLKANLPAHIISTVRTAQATRNLR